MTIVTRPRVLTAIKDVTVRYGGVVAVDDVSFDLVEGAIHGLIGPNGSGKSTLLAALSGVRRADAGSVLFDGVECRSLSAWRLARLGIARTFQGTRLIDGLTVRENIRLGAEWSRLAGRGGKAEIRDRVARAIERTGLAKVADIEPGGLPYGTQRLVELARAIAGGPRLLLLDEPTAGMTQGERAEIEEVQRALRADGVTQLLVEHDMRMIARLCDRVHVLNTGRLIAEGAADEVSRDPRVREAYLGHK